MQPADSWPRTIIIPSSCRTGHCYLFDLQHFCQRPGDSSWLRAFGLLHVSAHYNREYSDSYSETSGDGPGHFHKHSFRGNIRYSKHSYHGGQWWNSILDSNISGSRLHTNECRGKDIPYYHNVTLFLGGSRGLGPDRPPHTRNILPENGSRTIS